MRACGRSKLHIVMTMRSRCCTRSSAKWNAYVPHNRRCCVHWTNRPTLMVSRPRICWICIFMGGFYFRRVAISQFCILYCGNCRLAFVLPRARVCLCAFQLILDLGLKKNIYIKKYPGQRTPLEQSLAEAAPLAHQSSFVSCQGSGYQTPDGPSSKSSSGTSSPARASMLSSSSSSAESVDSADAAVIIEPEINIMLCDDEDLNYADVQSFSDEPDAPPTALAAKRPATVTTTAVSAQTGNTFSISICQLNSSKPTTPSTDALSALLTEGFLEPKRISLGLAPSEQSGQSTMHTLVPPLASYATALATSAASSVNLTPNLRRQHRRQSSTNAAVSWNETVSIKCSPIKQNLVKIRSASAITVPPITRALISQSAEHEELVTMRQKSLHRRHLSMGNASYSIDEAQARQRRTSNLSGARDEAALRAAQRPHSWGPVGTVYYMESLMCAFYEPALLHGPCIG